MSKTVLADVTLQRVNALGAPRRSLHGRGAVVFDKGVGYERLDLPAFKQQPAAQEFVDLLPQSVYFLRRVAAGTVAYNGKSWVSATLTGSGSVDGIVPRFVLQVESLTPQFLLDEIVWGGKSAVHVGNPVIDHVPLSEYRVTIDLKRALSAATGPSAGAMRLAIKDELAAAGSRPTMITVWVDGPGRAHRLRASVPGSGIGTTSMLLNGYGATLDANLPPPSQILSIEARTPGGRDQLSSFWPLGG